MNKSMRSRSFSTSYTVRRCQVGLTLVELMVGLVISIVVSLAAAALYLATREASRATQGQGDINETGKIALDMVGRELQKAGFYPAQFIMPSDLSRAGKYYNGKTSATTPAAKLLFNTGVYGCDNAKYKPADRTCDTPTGGAPDSVVINYFTSPEFGASSLLGNTNDCNRRPVSGDTDNAPRVAAGLPLFVSNRFGLMDTSYQAPDGSTISTKSLYCQGNGADTGGLEPAIQGIEDMVIKYGISPGGTTESPTKFLKAADVPLEGTSLEGLTPWQRVSAVSICMLVRSLENSRIEDKTGSVRRYTNCRGDAIDLPMTNRYLYKTFTRVYAIRNNLHAVGTF